jgi:Tol biopolymer transport system component
MALVAAGCGAAETTHTAAAPARASGCPVDLRELVPPDPLDQGREVNANGPTWSPDGRRLAFVAEGFDGVVVLTIEDCGVEEIRPEAKTVGADWPDWSPDGKLIVFANSFGGAGDGLFVMRPDGSGVRRITEGPDFFPAWSPDSRRIAFTRELVDEVEGTEDRNIWVVNADGTGLRRVTEGAWHGSADWSPDGEWLVTDADTEVIRIRPDGSGREVLIPGDHGYPSWSPDGRRLLVEGPMLAPGSGGVPEPLGTVGGLELEWSPDGEWIAFVDDMNTTDVWIVRRDGTGARRLTKGHER